MLQTMTVGHESPDWDDGLLMIRFQVWNAANNDSRAMTVGHGALIGMTGSWLLIRFQVWNAANNDSRA